MVSVLFSAVSDSNGCRSRRGAAEMGVVVPGELSTNGERINEWASADSFIRFGFVDRDATVGAAVPAWGRAVRMRRVVRARTAMVSVALMCLCFIESSFTSTGSVQVWLPAYLKTPVSEHARVRGCSSWLTETPAPGTRRIPHGTRRISRPEWHKRAPRQGWGASGSQCPGLPHAGPPAAGSPARCPAPF